MRNELSEKFLERISGVVPSAEAAADIARIQAIWTDLRRPGRHKREKGPFLFGRFSIADAFFSPVVTRFVTYGIPMRDEVAEYAETIMQLPAMTSWLAGAKAETHRMRRYE